MAYHTTIFRQMLQLISRLEFQSLVNQHQGDYRVRRLRCWDQFIHMLFIQLSHTQSLRDSISHMRSMAPKLYHLGCKPASRSTLSDANSKRAFQVYQELFFRLLHRTQSIAPKHHLKLNRKLYFIDSTTIDLCLKLFPWARFRKQKAAVKLHTILQADGSLPTFVNISDGEVHDLTALATMSLPAGSFVAIDRGYHCFKQYKVFQENNIRFVTRIKRNAKYQVVSSREEDASTGVLSDEVIQFTNYNSSKEYPYPLRKIRYWDSDAQKELVFLTNDFRLAAKTIADIYKARWEIEIFFKTIKQNLRIKRFVGNSPNAVMTQIWIALIAYLLVSYHKFMQRSSYSVQQVFRLLALHLFERVSLIELLKNQLPRPPNTVNETQLTLFKY